MQYTGIANCIDADLDNFKMLIDVLGVFPRGLYLNELIKVTRGELHWECDYNREAEIQMDYRSKVLVSPKKFYVPNIIKEMSHRDLLVSEFIYGTEIDTLSNYPQEVRNRVGGLMIELCFRELFEWKCM